MDSITTTVNRDITGTGSNESRHLAVAVTVLGQYFVAGENVSCTGREITVFEKTRFECYNILVKIHRGV